MRAILLPLDRALDLLVLLDGLPASVAADEFQKWLKCEIVGAAGGSAPENPTPWTPKAGERVETLCGHQGVVCSGPYFSRDAGGDPCYTVRSINSGLARGYRLADLRPAEEAR